MKYFLVIWELKHRISQKQIKTLIGNLLFSDNTDVQNINTTHNIKGKYMVRSQIINYKRHVKPVDKYYNAFKFFHINIFKKKPFHT